MKDEKNSRYAKDMKGRKGKWGKRKNKFVYTKLVVRRQKKRLPTDGPTDQPTDRPTDGWTYTPSHRVVAHD